MKKSVNDIGGENWGSISLQESSTPEWAKLSTALRGALGENGAHLVSLHEGRRAREDMGVDLYHTLGYFELGLQAIYDILVQKGVLNEREIQDRIVALKAARDNS
jgi:hypothetical protein